MMADPSLLPVGPHSSTPDKNDGCDKGGEEFEKRPMIEGHASSNGHGGSELASSLQFGHTENGILLQHNQLTGGKMTHSSISKDDSLDRASAYLEPTLDPLGSVDTIPSHNGNDIVLEEVCVEVENKSEAIELEGQRTSGGSAQHYPHSDPALEQHFFKDRELSETPTIEAIGAGEHGNETNIHGDKLEGVNEETQKVEEYVNGPIFPGPESNAETAFRPFIMQETTENDSLHNQGIKNVDDDQELPTSSESPSEDFHDIRELNLLPTLDRVEITNKLDGAVLEVENLDGLASMEERKHSTTLEADQSHYSSKVGLLEQGSVVKDITAAVLVSSDIEGWHRFDAEEAHEYNLASAYEYNLASGNGTSIQEARQLESWEQLLDDGLHGQEKAEDSLPLELGGLDTSLQDHSWQAGFASPGNPFIEGLDRLSNFSETEGFIFHDIVQSPIHPGMELGLATSLSAEEGFRDSTQKMGESMSGTCHHIDEKGRQQDLVAPGVENSDTQALGDAAEYGSMSQPEANHHSYTGAAGSSSLNSMEVYEAPSFMSLVDPESRELFRASMPIHEITNNVLNISGHPIPENDGRKNWDANFDMTMSSQSPSLSHQEITRSVSLPRVATGDVSAGEFPSSHVEMQNASVSPRGRQSLSTTGVGSTFSLRSLTPPSSPRNKRTSVMSPKLSPFVKKIVQKVRTSQAVASNVTSPKTAKNKSKPRSIWSICICCSIGN